MKLMGIICETNYNEPIHLKKLVTDKELEDYKTLAGKQIYFGEYYGKHSEVEGKYSLEDIKVEEVADDAVRILTGHVGKHISGEDYFDYYQVDDMHDEAFDFILEFMPEYLSKRLDEYILNGEEKEVMDYQRCSAIAKLVSFKTILDMEKLSEDGIEKLPEYFCEEIEKGLREN